MDQTITQVYFHVGLFILDIWTFACIIKIITRKYVQTFHNIPVNFIQVSQTPSQTHENEKEETYVLGVCVPFRFPRVVSVIVVVPHSDPHTEGWDARNNQTHVFYNTRGSATYKSLKTGG